MKLKKYEGYSEAEAISAAKAELGENAVIISIRTAKPGGLFGFLKRKVTEVTAAFDDEEAERQKELRMKQERLNDEMNKLLVEKELRNRKISDQQQAIEKLQAELKEASYKLSLSERKSTAERAYANSILQAFYDTMTHQGVLPEIAVEVLEEARQMSERENININLAAKIVYNNIINILGRPQPIFSEDGSDTPKTLFFMGPTGVGKTTTIAKISANLIFRHRLKVGLITSDTYRIAAVEQLKTYADILGIETGVVYEPKELEPHLEKMSPIYDVICIDTAGRSHRNDESLNDIRELLTYLDDSCRKYLVLSLTTKYEDLISIVNKFSEIADFRLILTKWDETLSYGTILNICYKTGRKADYLTMGQNVPDDIELMEPEILARALLGLGDGFNGGSGI